MSKIKPYDGRHDPQIKTLVELIQHKAAEHSYKGEWSAVEQHKLVDYLDGEYKELREAIVAGNLVETLREVGDVGFCLVMLAETLMRARTLTPEAIDFVRAKVEEDHQNDRAYGAK